MKRTEKPINKNATILRISTKTNYMLYLKLPTPVTHIFYNIHRRQKIIFYRKSQETRKLHKILNRTCLRRKNRNTYTNTKRRFFWIKTISYPILSLIPYKLSLLFSSFLFCLKILCKINLFKSIFFSFWSNFIIFVI